MIFGLSGNQLADVRAQIRNEESARADRLLARLSDATLIVACLVRQLGGTAKIPLEAMELHGTDAGSIDAWTQEDTRELCIRVRNEPTKGG